MISLEICSEVTCELKRCCALVRMIRELLQDCVQEVSYHYYRLMKFCAHTAGCELIPGTRANKDEFNKVKEEFDARIAQWLLTCHT